jgi:Uma2 family endonuclease
MVLETKILTAEEFDRIALLPENANKLLEFIGGRIVEVVSNSYSSILAARILIKLGIFTDGKDLGYFTTSDGGYMVNGERYIPDVAFISKIKQPTAPHESYISKPPDLAVEVLSPSNTDNEITIKVINYLLAGTVVWVVNPDKQYVVVYIPNQKPQTVDIDGVLDGGDVLPGFTLPVKDIFAS